MTGLAALGLPMDMYFYTLSALLIVWAITAIIYAYLQSRAESGPTAPGNSTVH